MLSLADRLWRGSKAVSPKGNHMAFILVVAAVVILGLGAARVQMGIDPLCAGLALLAATLLV